ncbi:MAG: GNAT family N-acetyltransferase [Gemmatimonadota bacterium]|nr:GNAT family N-acetyltransferase [Gemmatimonadota bacterium]
MSSLRVGEVDVTHRDRIGEILRATDLFRDEEIDVAMELFDLTCPAVIAAKAEIHVAVANDGAAISDYFFLGVFTPEGELAGFACYGPTPGTDRTFDLYWIAVDPAAQGAGSGTTLLTEVERRLKGLNARLVVVETSSRSDYVGTRGFYLHRGYVEAAVAREFYAPADDRITFTKRLQSRASSRSGWGAHGVMSQ